MNKKKQNKYNKTSKSKDWFPFKNRQFNCWESPILNSSEKCSYKTEALQSFQERQMLNSIVSSLQTNTRDVIRISIMNYIEGPVKPQRNKLSALAINQRQRSYKP